MNFNVIISLLERTIKKMLFYYVLVLLGITLTLILNIAVYI